MRLFFLTIGLVLLLGQSVFAQKKRERLDMAMFNLNYNYLLNSQGQFKQRFYSHGFDFTLMYDHIMSQKAPISIGVGLGVSSMHFFTDANLVNIDTTQGSYSTFVPIDTSLSNIKRSRFTTNYYEIPVELRFRTNPEDEDKHPWKFAIGAKLGFRINSRDKLIDEDGYRVIDSKYPNTSRVRGIGTVRIGYGKVALYGAYQFSSLFHENHGVELYPISVGLNISLF